MDASPPAWIAPEGSVPQDAARSLALQRARVSVLAWAGYLFLPAIAIVLISIPALVAISGRAAEGPAQFALLVLLCGLPGLRILRSMSFGEEAPSGVAVTEQEAPELFALIEDVRAAISGPRVDAVFITDELNAAAVQRAPRGMFGRWRNELLIGLPLLMAHERDEIAGIIAHELGHFAGAHGRLHARIARTRIVWVEAARRDRLAAALAQWYLPRFSAAASRLSRAHEHDADRCEVMAVGSETAARSLCRSMIASALLEDFWETFYAANVSGAKPDPMPYEAMSRVLPHASDWEPAANCLKKAFAEDTGSHDNHPCLRERLSAVGGVCALPPPVSASTPSLLGTAFTRSCAAMDAAWWRAVEEEWVRRGRRNGKLAALEETRRTRAEPWGPKSALAPA